MVSGAKSCIVVFLPQQASLPPTPGLPVPSPQIHSQLLSILEDPRPPPSHPLSYLTTMERDTWAGLREELVANEENRNALEKIDSALFVLCLDDNQPTTAEDATHTLLHNYGANRCKSAE